MSFARHAASRVRVSASPEALFAFLDDFGALGGHMEKPSAMMFGGSMHYAFDAGHGQSVGSVIKMRGDVLGVRLALEEVVTERAPLRKVWETRGQPDLLVIGPYRMGFEIQPEQIASNLRVFVDYDFPPRGFSRMLGLLFGAAYAHWCVDRMAKTAMSHFGRGA